MKKIPYKTLGKSGLLVSIMGLGGIPLQKIDAKQTRELIDVLEAKGVNFIDSARGYSISEELIGQALLGRREKFILASKSRARSYDTMAKDIELSLDNLRTDHIDLYQLHNVGVNEIDTVFAKNGAAAAIRDAISAGKVKHLGATAHTVEALEKLAETSEIETVMFPYNIAETQGKDVMLKIREKNIGFLAMKPLAGGNIDDPRLAIRYVLNDADCTMALVGMCSVEEAKENIGAAMDLTPLGKEEEEQLISIRKQLGSDFCRRCDYCAPCSVGINISGCFILANYIEKYQLADWATSLYLAFDVYAGQCIGCGKCEERCPYDLPIRDKMRYFAELFGK